MIAVRLPADLENSLSDLAVETGRTKAFHIREAITEYLKNLKNKKRFETWVLDTNNPTVQAQLEKECEAIRNSDGEKEALAFCEAVFEENIPDDWKW